MDKDKIRNTFSSAIDFKREFEGFMPTKYEEAPYLIEQLKRIFYRLADLRVGVSVVSGHSDNGWITLFDRDIHHTFEFKGGQIISHRHGDAEEKAFHGIRSQASKARPPFDLPDPNPRDVWRILRTDPGQVSEFFGVDLATTLGAVQGTDQGMDPQAAFAKMVDELGTEPQEETCENPETHQGER